MASPADGKKGDAHGPGGDKDKPAEKKSANDKESKHEDLKKAEDELTAVKKKIEDVEKEIAKIKEQPEEKQDKKELSDLRSEKLELLKKENLYIERINKLTGSQPASIDAVPRFKELLKGKVKPNDKIIDVIVKFYSNRLLAISTQAQALALYRDGEAVPQTQTRFHLSTDLKIKVDGPMPSSIPSGSGASFFIAFFNNVPCALKVFSSEATGKVEVEVVKALGDTKGFLVPCKIVPVTASSPGGSREKPIRFDHGLLMPLYACSAAALPKPVDASWVIDCGKRMLESLSFVHGQKLAHLDIKPSNMFLDQQGLAWLGDYGNVLPFGSSVTSFTPQYVPELEELKSSAQLDKWMLAISLLELVGVLASPPTPIKPSDIPSVLAKVQDDTLRQFITELLKN